MISATFLAFFAVVVIVHWAAPPRSRVFILLAASAAFYIHEQTIAGIASLAGIVVFGYLVGRRMGSLPEDRRLPTLLVGVAGELGMLIAYKYVAPSSSPLGISFFTFTSLSYLIDIYYDMVPVERRVANYALYVSFFPQIVSGPIARATKLLPQIDAHESRAFSYDDVAEGLRLMLWGFAQKVLIANRLAEITDPAFDNPAGMQGLMILVPAILLPFQIYCDFAGYTDIARGAARTLGIDLLPNFEHPYGATSPSDLWRRWHMSLYGWLTDYVYTPIAMGARGLGRLAPILGLWTTFLLSAVWHGTKLTYIAWASIHALVLSVEVWRRKARTEPLSRGEIFLRRCAIMILLIFADIVFRARSLPEVGLILTNMAHLAPAAQLRELLAMHGASHLIIAFAMAALIQIIQTRPGPVVVPGVRFLRARPARWVAYCLVFWAIIYFGRLDTDTFLYGAF